MAKMPADSVRKREGEINTPTDGQRCSVCVRKKIKLKQSHKATKKKNIQCETTNFHLLSSAANCLFNIKAGLTSHKALDTIMCLRHIYYPQCCNRRLKQRQYIPALKSPASSAPRTAPLLLLAKNVSTF